MRLTIFTFAFLFFSTVAFGQEATKRSPVKSLDFDQMYSTPHWKPDEVTALKANLGNAMAETVIRASNEAAWPEGIASLGSRAQNKAQMAGYKTYFLANMDAHRVILVVPAAENRSMPESMQPAGDIYFVFLKVGVQLESIATTAAAVALITDDFSAQMDEITRDFSNGFANVVNMILEQDNENLLVTYGTLVPLDGTSRLYFLEDLFASTTNFYAEFPGSTNIATALVGYRALVRKVEALKLSCCGLSKGEEQVSGNRYTQPFRAFDSKGNMDAAYQSMVIEVYLLQDEAFDKKGQLVPEWRPALVIYAE